MTMSDRDAPGFEPPPYPYDRLDAFQKIAAQFDGGVVDLSIGTPCDPPPQAVIDALSNSASTRKAALMPSASAMAAHQVVERIAERLRDALYALVLGEQQRQLLHHLSLV